MVVEKTMMFQILTQNPGYKNTLISKDWLLPLDGGAKRVPGGSCPRSRGMNLPGVAINPVRDSWR
jgi:hypothetical protein